MNEENRLKRIEIFANKAVEEDILDGLKKAGVGKNFTLVPIVFGEGNSTPKWGSHIWPEENFQLIIYASEEEAETITDVITQVKQRFTQEGIKLFCI